MKKLLIVLFTVLTVFALASCKEEPAPHVHSYTTNNCICSECGEADYSRAILVPYHADGGLDYYELDMTEGKTYICKFVINYEQEYDYDPGLDSGFFFFAQAYTHYNGVSYSLNSGDSTEFVLYDKDMQPIESYENGTDGLQAFYYGFSFDFGTYYIAVKPIQNTESKVYLNIQKAEV